MEHNYEAQQARKLVNQISSDQYGNPSSLQNHSPLPDDNTSQQNYPEEIEYRKQYGSSALSFDVEMNKPQIKRIHTFSYGGGGTRCAACLGRLYYGEGCKYFYAFLILINVFLIAWTIIDYKNVPDNVYLHFVEIGINSLMIIDTLLRLCLYGLRKYFRRWINALEFLTFFGCIICIILTIYSYYNPSEIEEVTDQILLISICAVQYMRIVIFIKNTKENKDSGAGRINFDNMQKECSPDGIVEVDVKRSDLVGSTTKPFEQALESPSFSKSQTEAFRFTGPVLLSKTTVQY